MGAGHGDELPMLFGTHGNYRGASTSHQIAVSEAMQDAWRAFANDPTGGLKGQDWPEYTTSYDVVRVFGEDESVAKNEVDVLKKQEDACADFLLW
jgi:carboxylesterase type B